MNMPEGTDGSGLDAWEPTTLVGLWPDDRAPTLTEVQAAMNAIVEGGSLEVEDVEAEDDKILWARAVSHPSFAAPVLVWAEPAQPLSPDELDDLAALGCRWVVGVESMLDGDEPLASFASLVRLLAGSIPDCPAILDTNSGRWFPREALDEQFFGADDAPSEHALWIIHAIAGDGADAGGAWLHTHGLWRCGRPELEMLEVPTALVHAAGELLNSIAGRLLEEPTPPPGEPYSVGPGLEVTLHPWQEVAQFIADEAPGGPRDRGDDGDEHAGVRAVICGPRPEGAYRKLWRWPREAIERLDAAEALIFLSRGATERRARSARATWPQLATCFASLPNRLLRTDTGTDSDGSVRFIIKAGLAAEETGDELEREHLWFVVRRFAGDRAEGTLVNRPVTVGGLARGDVVWVKREHISDWSVLTPLGSFDPLRVAAMEQAIDALREGGATS
jgi:uncharacterized protein YegJ (DUF2314 family)